MKFFIKKLYCYYKWETYYFQLYFKIQYILFKLKMFAIVSPKHGDIWMAIL